MPGAGKAARRFPVASALLVLAAVLASMLLWSYANVRRRSPSGGGAPPGPATPPPGYGVVAIAGGPSGRLFAVARDGLLLEVAGAERNLEPRFSLSQDPDAVNLFLASQSGDFLVSYYPSGRIARFSADGALTYWLRNENGTVFAAEETSGAPVGICGIAMDKSGNIYVADASRGRVLRFTNAGMLTRWELSGAPRGEFVAGGGQQIALSDGDLLVLCPRRREVWVWDTEGHLVRRLAKSRETPFVFPAALAVSDKGDLFVADLSARAVFRFDANGRPAGRASVGNPLSRPVQIAVGRDGSICVLTANDGAAGRETQLLAIRDPEFGRGGRQDAAP